MNRLIFSILIGLIVIITIPDGSRNIPSGTAIVIIIESLLILYILFFFNGKQCQKVIYNYRWIWFCLLSWLIITIAQTMEVLGYSNYDKYASLPEFLLYLGYVSFLFLMLCLLHNIKRIKLIIIVFIGVAVVQTIFGMVNYFSGGDTGGWVPTHWAAYQATGTFINRNFYANLMVLCLGFTLVPLIVQRPEKSSRSNTPPPDWLNQLALNAGYFGATVLLFSGIMMSRSRGGLAALIVALAFSLVMVWVCKATKLKIKWLITGGAISVIFFGFELMQKRLSYGIGDGITRINQWKATLELIWQKWFAGYGPGSYEEAYKSNIPFDASPLTHNHAHNDYLELLLEQGLIGSLPLLGFICLVFYFGIKKLIAQGSFSRAKIIFSAMFGVIGMLTHSMVDFPLQVPSNVIYFLTLIAIMLASVQLDFKPKRTRSQQ